MHGVTLLTVAMFVGVVVGGHHERDEDDFARLRRDFAKRAWLHQRVSYHEHEPDFAKRDFAKRSNADAHAADDEEDDFAKRSAKPDFAYNAKPDFALRRPDFAKRDFAKRDFAKRDFAKRNFAKRARDDDFAYAGRY